MLRQSLEGHTDIAKRLKNDFADSSLAAPARLGAESVNGSSVLVAASLNSSSPLVVRTITPRAAALAAAHDASANDTSGRNDTRRGLRVPTPDTTILTQPQQSSGALNPESGAPLPPTVVDVPDLPPTAVAPRRQQSEAEQTARILFGHWIAPEWDEGARIFKPCWSVAPFCGELWSRRLYPLLWEGIGEMQYVLWKSVQRLLPEEAGGTKAASVVGSAGVVPGGGTTGSTTSVAKTWAVGSRFVVRCGASGVGGPEWGAKGWVQGEATWCTQTC